MVKPAVRRLRALLSHLHRLSKLRILVLVAHLIGLVSSVDALMSARTAQGTVAWMIALNAMPYVAVPAYWVFGRSEFQGYVTARRGEDSALSGVLQEAGLDAYRGPGDEGVLDPRLQVLETLADSPFRSDHTVELLVNGETAFPSMLEGLAGAREYVLLQSYIVRDDDLGLQVQQTLIALATSGVAVHLLIDDIGSVSLPRSYLSALTDAGVQVRRFDSSRGWTNLFQINFRNHRKLLIVDGREAWMGGINIGDEYLDGTDRLGPWRDTQLRLAGPAVLDLQLMFVEDWHWATGQRLELHWKVRPPGDGADVLILASGPADRLETASLFFHHLSNAATRRLWISSPYFVPDEALLSALQLAALRGVDVRLLVPQRSDSRLLDHAARVYFPHLLDAGVRIYRYQAGFMHGKAFLVDSLVAGVGTANLDNRSLRLNFEVTAAVVDAAFVESVEAMFQEDFAAATALDTAMLDGASFWSRLAARAAYLFAPVLRLWTSSGLAD